MRTLKTPLASFAGHMEVAILISASMLFGLTDRGLQSIAGLTPICPASLLPPLSQPDSTFLAGSGGYRAYSRGLSCFSGQFERSLLPCSQTEPMNWLFLRRK